MQEVDIATARPRPVRIAVLLQLAVAVLDLAAIVISAVRLPGMVSGAMPALTGRDLNGPDPAALAAIAVGVAVGAMALAVVFDVLAIVFATRMGRGRHWARVVLTVFAALRVTQLIGLASGPDPTDLLTVAIAAGSVAAIVLAFRPTANAWFRALRAARARP